MAKIKLTKGELKKQRDSLKQFRRYLPTLQLKKQQLQTKILEARKELENRLSVVYEKENNIAKWVGLLGDSEIESSTTTINAETAAIASEQILDAGQIARIDLRQWITPVKVLTGTTNIAGANVPTFEDVQFKNADYDFYSTPFWIDRGIEELRMLIIAMVEADIVKRQIQLLEKELRTTTQRVNLFEKIKIPECQESIRKISIYLGDQQANAVGIGKVAKKKVEQASQQAALV